MDILQDLINSLEKEEIKSYKLYAKRTHDFTDRKDIELFESIKKHITETDTYHFNTIYNGVKPDTKYYRLKNKIANDLGVVLCNLNHKKPEIDTLHLLSLAKIFNLKQQHDLSIHYLKLAERRAIEKEDYAILESIYEQVIHLSIQNTSENPIKIIEKRNENSQRLKLLQDLENNLAILSYEVKTTQNLASKKEVSQWLNHTLKNTLKLSYVQNSAQLRIKIFQNLSRLMLLLKDYSSLELYLKSCLLEFDRDKLFTKHTHEIKIQLLVYLCNVSNALHKYTQSIQYADILSKSLYEYDKLLYNNYIFYYYNILVNTYSKTNIPKAIEILTEAQNEKQIKNNPNQYFYVLNNLAILYFDLKKHKLASKLFSQMYVSQIFKTFDKAFVLKLHVFELINRLELNDYELCDKQLKQIQKMMPEIKDKDSIKLESSIITIVEHFLSQEDKRWRPLKPLIQRFIKTHPQNQDQYEIISYTQWLGEKI